VGKVITIIDSICNYGLGQVLCLTPLRDFISNTPPAIKGRNYPAYFTDEEAAPKELVCPR
jgi:hypothetical protein